VSAPHDGPQFRLALLFTWGIVMALLLAVARSSSAPRLDFTIFYSGARIVLDGRGAELYSTEVQRHYQRRLFARPHPLPYNHPPFELLPFLPLAMLPYRWAYLVWSAVNTAIAVSVPLLLRPLIRVPENPFARELVVLMFLPLWVALGQGQDSMLLLLLVTLALRGLASEGKGLAGASIGLAMFKFHIAGPLLVLLARRGGARFLGGAVGAMAGAAAISALLVGWRTTLNYPRFVLEMDRTGGFGTIAGGNMPNLRGIAETIARGPLPLPVLGLLHVALLLVALAVCWRSPRPYAPALLFTLLLSFHLYTHDLSLLLLPMMLLMNTTGARVGAHGSAPGTPAGGDAAGAARTITFLLCFAVLYSPWTYIFLGGDRIMSLAAIPIAGLAFLGAKRA
jgi:hypothetical protein